MRLSRVSAALVILVGSIGFAASAAHAQDVRVPRDTGAHRTPDVVKHTVKRGDTLWDIARFYLKDPFRWPDVFHANTDIVKNPHWIYPGQVLTIDGSAVKPEVAARADHEGFIPETQVRAQQPTVFAQNAPSPIRQRVGSITNPPALTVRPGEFEAAPYMVPADQPTGAGKVVGAVETLALGLSSDAGFRYNDRLYVTAPAGVSLRIGDRMLVARSRTVIADVGRVIEPTGVVRIDSVGAKGLAIGTLVQQYGTVVPDQMILPAAQGFVSTVTRPVRGVYPTSARLLWIQGDPRLPSLQTYVLLGTRAADSVRPGDQFTLFYDERDSAERETPPIASALVTIVRVTPLGASGLIVAQTQPHISVDMPAHLTARMP